MRTASLRLLLARCARRPIQLEQCSSGSASSSSRRDHAAAAAGARCSAASLQLQQLPTAGFCRLLQQLQGAHAQQQQLAARYSSSAAPLPAAAAAPQEPQPPQQQLPALAPYQQAAVDAALRQLGTAQQQRMLVRLPPTADVAPVVAALAAAHARSLPVLLLLSSSARAAAVRSALQQLLQLQPGGAPAPRVVPGELLRQGDTLMLVDLQQLQRMPAAAVPLQHHGGTGAGLGVYEEGFVAGAGPAAAVSSGVQHRGRQHHRQQQQLPVAARTAAAQQRDAPAGQQPQQQLLLSDATRTAAEALLRHLRFLEPNPGRLLVTITSRDWHSMLAQQQHPQGGVGGAAESGSASRRRRRRSTTMGAAASSSQRSSQRSSEAVAEQRPAFQLPEFQLSYAAALEAGLVRPAVAHSVACDSRLPVGVLQAADAALAALSQAAAATGGGSGAATEAAVAAAEALSRALAASSGSSGSAGSREQQVVAAFRAVSRGGKALVVAASESHARALAVAFNLQGISSLVLHEAQAAADQQTVLAAFAAGGDSTLVASSVVAAGGSGMMSALGCAVECVLMAAPTLQLRLYAAALAPGVLPATSSSNSSSSSSSSSPCIVVDFVDTLVASDTSSSSRRGGGSGGSGLRALTCVDVLGAAHCRQLPLPGAGDADGSSPADAAAAAGSSRIMPAHQEPVTTGDLTWTVLDSERWAIPVKRGRGVSMAGGRVLWLRKAARGWVPEVEEGVGATSPLPGTSGKPLRLQRARNLAEAWLKAEHPHEAALREVGGEWRNRPLSAPQAAFCDRQAIPYDPSWTRGAINAVIDRYVLQEMRVPATERQAFLLSHFTPFAPSHMLGSRSSAMMYRHAAEAMLSSLLTGSFARSGRSAAAAAAAAAAKLPASSVAAATAAAAAEAAAGGGGGGVLHARAALMEDLEAQFAAGLRPRHTWLVIHGHDLLLDLLSGSYLWLRRVAPAGDGGRGGGVAEAGGSVGGVGAEASSSDCSSSSNSDVDGCQSSSSGSSSSSSDSSDSDADGDDAASSDSSGGGGGLDASALYELTLQLPDGSHHPVSSGPAAVALAGAYAATGSASSDGDSSGSAASRRPLPLSAALLRAERIAASLATAGAALLGREAAVRLTAMVGGWKVPGKSVEAHTAMPASARQLEQLQAAGLPHSRRYTCVDAHREFVRHLKTHGLPEPPATPSQLARIAELQLPLRPGVMSDAAAGGDAAAAPVLTAAEARALLFRAQLAGEAQAVAAAKAAERAKARSTVRGAGGKRLRGGWA